MKVCKKMLARSVRLTPEHWTELEWISRLNRVEVSDVLRIAVEITLSEAKRESGRLPFAPRFKGLSKAAEAQADALLIAAAPELLEIARRFVAEWDSNGFFEVSHEALAVKAREVISRAEKGAR